MIRVFPRRTKWTPDDDLVFVGDPPLFRPAERPVLISVTLTWDIHEGERLRRAWSQFYSDVRIGGPAWGDPGGEFVAGRFLKLGVTITSRGCRRACPWCFVPGREGTIRELSYIVPGHIVQDNNLLACSRGHIEKVFEMLRKQKQGIEFKGGLDIGFLQAWHVDLLKKIRLSEIWVACDHDAQLHQLERASELLSDFPILKKRCYVMIGYKENLSAAERRLERVYELGFLPFSQLYRSEWNESYPMDWKKLNRKWSRPAAYRKAPQTSVPGLEGRFYLRIRKSVKES